MQCWGLSDKGNVRSENQDTYVIRSFGRDRTLLLVCDGMGGAKAGNVASMLAAECFVQTVTQQYRAAKTEEAITAMLHQALADANRVVFEKSGEEEFHGMGTTLVAAYAYRNTAYLLNVGDSRAYLCKEEGITKITTDHSIVELMVQRGELSSEEAKTYPGCNLITRAVGTEETVEGDLYVQPMEKGSCLLLCSDGLSGEMADQEILFEVLHGGAHGDCCQRLLNVAKNRGAPDNVTVILAEF